MFNDILRGFGCGCEGPEPRKCATSCDVLWIIVLLMVVFKGGMFGLDLCTLIILFIVFGSDLLHMFTKKPCGC
ncbi:MAG: hypothetical protein LBQ05_01645 [Christensenellaceae bacterium]|jgi:hypothetical protein|nr:hypothetical protein [Christensenellaceae bacterium]